jgi:hypothetical protein
MKFSAALAMSGSWSTEITKTHFAIFYLLDFNLAGYCPRQLSFHKPSRMKYSAIVCENLLVIN